MIHYDVFFRKFGIRKLEMLLSPITAPIELLELPRLSIFHHPGDGPLDDGPAPDEFLFRNIRRRIPVMQVTQLAELEGNPRIVPIQFSTVIRQYFIKNRRYLSVTDSKTGLRDVNVPLVYNYSFLHRTYRYVRSLYSEYNKWHNINATVWDNISKTVTESERNHFIDVTLPKSLPSLFELKMAAEAMTVAFESEDRFNFVMEGFAEALNVSMEAMTQRTLAIFNSPESLFLLEIWKWCGEGRSKSMISKIDKEQLKKVNLIFQESGRWTVLNLGVIDSWRKPSENDGDFKGQLDERAATKGLEPKQLQYRVLRFVMAMLQIRNGVVTNDVVEAAGSEDEDTGKDTGEATTIVKSATPVEPLVHKETHQHAHSRIHSDGSVKTPTEEVDVSAVVADNVVGTIDTVDDIKVDQEIENQIEKDLEALDAIQKENHEAEMAAVDTFDMVAADKAPDEAVMEICNRLADDGGMTAAEYRRYQELSKSYKQIPAPYGTGTLETFMKVNPEVVQIKESKKIPDIPSVFDKTMLKSTLQDFDSVYLKEVFHKDVAGMVMGVQNAGLCVTGYEVERVEDILGSYDIHSVRVTPVEGTPSTLRFKLPVIDDEGVYSANGIKYRMRKQRGDMPIRKISFDKVALTSYYGKTFVSRSEKRVDNYGVWLRNSVMAKGMDPDDKTIEVIQPSNVFDSAYDAPRLYSTLAMGFREITFVGKFVEANSKPVSVTLYLDHVKLEKVYGDKFNSYSHGRSSQKFKPCGKTSDGRDVLIDQDDALYVVNSKGVYELLLPFEECIELDLNKKPVEFAVLKVQGKPIPVGVVLAYEMGLERLLRYLKVTPRRVMAGQRANVTEDEFSVVFSDETLVFNRDDRLAAMVFGGFNEYHRAIKSFNSHEFDRPGVYLNVLESAGLGARYLREIDLMYRMFIDPITKELLIGMNEPTDFRGLLIRSCKMLLIDQHPDELDPAYMRLRGYERMAGAVYTEIVRSIRGHAGRPGKAKAQIDLNPFAVWKTITQDPSIALVSDINPIENLKAQESVTYNGAGGRSSRSMVKRTRAYHPNDMGTISEATKDSSDTGINIYTSADPMFTSLRGTSRRFDLKNPDPSSLLSSSALVSPASDRDDGKRVNFVSIQHEHTVPCNGYRPALVRTGYEQVIAKRTGDMFAFAAKKDGKIVDVTENAVCVEYVDGERRYIEIGRRYGNSGGLTIPQEVVANVKIGQKVKEGDILTYNPGFFEKDPLCPGTVVWKTATLVKTALFESTDTLEDSSTISKRVAELLKTKTTKVRTIVVTFDQSVRKLIKVGDVVESEDILCIIEDAVTSRAGMFDEESIEALRVLGAQTPMAKSKGVVERIEVFYHGEKEDMSETLRSIVNASDKELMRRSRELGKKSFTGQVDESFRVEGEPLALDSMAIRIYITGDAPAGIGDKGVFCNQLKTVFGKVQPFEIRTESGIIVDGIFGQKSIYDRIVTSPFVIGTTTTLLKVVAKKAVEIYRK